MKLVAALARSLQADRRTCATSNARWRPARVRRAADSGPSSAGRRRSVLIRGKVCVRRCRLVFRDCGAGTGGGLAAYAGSHGCGVLLQKRLFISVSIGASAGSKKMASMSAAGCKENGLYVSVNRRLRRVMRPRRCKRAIPVTVASKMWLDMASLPRERAFCSRNV